MSNKPILMLKDFTPSEWREVQALNDWFSLCEAQKRLLPAIHDSNREIFADKIEADKVMLRKRKDAIEEQVHQRKTLRAAYKKAGY